MNSQTVNSLYNFLPELTLSLTIVITNALSVFTKKTGRINYYFPAAGLLLVLLLTFLEAYTLPQTAFNGLLVIDHFAYFGKILIVLSSFIFFLLFYTSQNSTSEFILLLTFTLGAMLSVGSSDLVMLFVSLEVMSISIYILISGKRIIALKNYIYGITVSAIMLFGASLMFGICGTTGYYSISEYLSANSFNPLTLTISVLLITFAIGYRMMLFPFNLYFPTYSEKLPVRQLALISITGVITSALVLIRFLLTAFHDGNSFITGSEIYSIIPGIKMDLLLSVISAASVITGSILILWQKNLKKIFAFIMISQAGNLIMGLAASSPGGSNAALFNIAVLLIIMTGLLYCIRIFEDKFQAVTIDDLKHKGKSGPLLFFTFIFFLSCAAGFPLTAGFSGRLILIIAALSKDLFWLAAISILSSFVMFYFIFKLTYTIFSGKPVINHVPLETHRKFILLVFLVPAILFGFYLSPLFDWVKFGALILGISSAN